MVYCYEYRHLIISANTILNIVNDPTTMILKRLTQPVISDGSLTVLHVINHFKVMYLNITSYIHSLF